MSLGMNNIYELLGEDDDVKPTQAPAPAKKQATQQPAQQAKTASSKPKEPVKKAATAPAAVPDAPVKENRQSKPRGSATGNNRNFPPKKAKEVPSPGTKRVFDRRSGTGRGKTENKKGGAGKGNWGASVDETANPAEAKEKVEEPTSEAKEEEQKEKAEEGKEKTAQEEAPKEEEDKTLTLEEYKKKMKKVKTAKPKVRESGEGVNQDEWKDAKVLERDQADTITLVPKKPAKKEEAKKEESPKGKKEGTNVAEEKVPVDKVFAIAQEKKAFRPRGGPGSENRRGGGKGFRSGTGGNKRSSGSGKSFDFNEESFPALTTKA